MTDIKGFDAGSNTTMFARALAADGMRFAGRYLTRGTDGRTLHKTEVEMLHKNGIAVICIFQHKNNEPGYFTLENAKKDVDAALRRANELGLPRDCVIAFAVDTDVIPANEAGVLTYAQYVWEQMQGTDWLLGWYGDDRVIQRVLDDLDAGHIAYMANAKGWRETGIPDSWDILQMPQRKHPCGLWIDDAVVSLVDDDVGQSLRAVGMWLP